VKEKWQKPPEGMTLQEERECWRLLREGKIKLTRATLHFICDDEETTFNN
jgi:hypothetical protein